MKPAILYNEARCVGSVQASEGQQRGAGVDGQSIEDFERDLKNNLYRVWNRMCSGSYFPPPVRRVDIPKGDTGETRPLGIPTVADRIAQMVVKRFGADPGAEVRQGLLWISAKNRHTMPSAWPGSDAGT